MGSIISILRTPYRGGWLVVTLTIAGLFYIVAIVLESIMEIDARVIILLKTLAIVALFGSIAWKVYSIAKRDLEKEKLEQQKAHTISKGEE